MTATPDPFNARDTLDVAGQGFTIYRLDALKTELSRYPVTVRILLENVLRNAGRGFVTEGDVKALVDWKPNSGVAIEVPFMPGRVVLQDFTGVPCVVDLAAMRDAMTQMGGNPDAINPLVPADMVIDHSVMVDRFGDHDAFQDNVDIEYQRNGERYALLRWAQQAFDNFRVVPPGNGIVHQVNLEKLAPVVDAREVDGELVAFPDTLVGTDSHTTMINGIGVIGFGVGGIEAEAVMLGQPISLPTPVVVGLKLTGSLPPGATATDLVLTVTELLRKQGVVGKFVEAYGSGLSSLALADRATIANMSPEFGATGTLFPVDDETLRYMRNTGRPEDVIARTEAYCKAQGLFRTDADPDPQYDENVVLDLGTIVPSLAGPSRPQDRVVLGQVASSFKEKFPEGLVPANGQPEHYQAVDVTVEGTTFPLSTGKVAIAAITSCTNTSNPSVMLGAGILAKKAVEKGLTVPPWVKTSLAPGSRAVTGYLEKAGLQDSLDALGFDLVGYGCTTCIGNSGPLPEPMTTAIDENKLVAAAVLSGNRNFEGRIHPQVRASYLASPPLVVAYALAGRVDLDLTTEPLGEGTDGPVYLRDIWPTPEEVQEAIRNTITSELFQEGYENVFTGDEKWQNLPVPDGSTYEWDAKSTYVQSPPFFANLAPQPGELTDIVGARALAVLGDSVTTDHISPAGSIPSTSPAGTYLQENGVTPKDFNSFGSRRGNHEVMMRGTFGNIRLRNALAEGKEGNWTKYLPTGEIEPIYDASMKYQASGTPLVVLAGSEYGTGSSRDWAAKGTLLLGVKAVIAQSFERIHRGNLVGMGILPLQFLPGENASTLGLDGTETFSIAGLGSMEPRQRITVDYTRADGSTGSFETQSRIDGPTELNYLRNGGILPTVLRRIYQDTKA
ncbi:MAG: aconitate hydratase AcnA [Thermoleophilia bacterium]|nr:aconitate hydratase AcnA [Thermoleophilia bacterium]